MQIKKMLPALMVAVMMLIGCGNSENAGGSYDFDDKSLEHVVGVQENVLNASTTRATGKTQISEEEDIYLYNILVNGAQEQITIDTKANVVYSVELSMEGGIRSEYGIYGIHIGDTLDAAKSMAEITYGDDGMWYTVGDVEFGSYVGTGKTYNRKGALMISVDCKSGKVISIYLVKE